MDLVHSFEIFFPQVAAVPLARGRIAAAPLRLTSSLLTAGKHGGETERKYMGY